MIVRILAVLLVLSSVAWADKSPNAGKKEHLERVVAVVNDSIILQSELDARLVPVRAEAAADRRSRGAPPPDGQARQPGARRDGQRGADRPGRRGREDRGRSSSEVQAALDEIKQQNNLDDAGLQQALAQQGYTLQGYRADLRRQLLRLRAVNQLVVAEGQRHRRGRPRPLRRDAAPLRGGERGAAVAHPDQAAGAPDRAADRRGQGQGGQGDGSRQERRGVREVAKQASEDPSTAPNGGALGWFQRGSINPDWEQIVFSMQEGRHARPGDRPAGAARVLRHRRQAVGPQTVRPDEGSAAARAAAARARQGRLRPGPKSFARRLTSISSCSRPIR